MSIPRRIIQTAKSRDLPPLAKAAAANLRLLHPDWEHLFFDDRDVDAFITREYPQHRELFESFPHKIQRFDFFRYLAVLHHGGFYFDLDVFLSEPIEDLCAHSSVFPFEELTLNRYLLQSCNLDWELGNYAFGAAAGDPFLQAIVDSCVRARQDPAWSRELLGGIPRIFRADFHVLYTTGPGLITRTWAEATSAARQTTILFAGDVCDERNWHRFGRYGVHLMEASWRGRKSFLRQRLCRYWETARRRAQLATSRTLGPTRTTPVFAPQS